MNIRTSDIRLLAADMDGTVLNDNREISSRTQAAIHSWVAAGRHFVPTTGRPMVAMNKISDLFKEDMPFIVYNGAMAIMHRSKEILFSINLDPALVPEIYQLGTNRNIPVIIWCQEQLYVNKDCEPVRLYEEATNAPFKVLDSPGQLKELADIGITKMLWIDYPDRVLIHQKDMRAHFGDKLNCHASWPTLFEFVDPSASKAAAMEKLGKKLGVLREEMAAIGDGYNDLSMLRYAGYSIAMGNAPDDIKAECDYVTLNNNEDGVAVWIEQALGYQK